MFSNRIYREKSNRKGLTSFTVTVKETDLHIQAESNLSEMAKKAILRERGYIESYIADHPRFQTSLIPMADDPFAPPIVRGMIHAATKAGVGPMAAIAGAISHGVGDALFAHSREVIVENGGDIFFCTRSDTTFAIYAGTSPLSMKIGVKVTARKSAMGICTSSGTIGHSKSFGNADAVTVISSSCALADAAATALANQVSSEKDIDHTLAMGQKIEGVEGLLIIKGEKLGAWGDLELVGITP